MQSSSTSGNPESASTREGSSVAYRREQGVDEVVGQHEVGDGVCVGGSAEVLMVVSAEGCVNAMVPVEHACDPIKPEAIKPAYQHGSAPLGCLKYLKRGPVTAHAACLDKGHGHRDMDFFCGPASHSPPELQLLVTNHLARDLSFITRCDCTDATFIVLHE